MERFPVQFELLCQSATFFNPHTARVNSGSCYQREPRVTTVVKTLDPLTAMVNSGPCYQREPWVAMVVITTDPPTATVNSGPCYQRGSRVTVAARSIDLSAARINSGPYFQHEPLVTVVAKEFCRQDRQWPMLLAGAKGDWWQKQLTLSPPSTPGPMPVLCWAMACVRWSYS